MWTFAHPDTLAVGTTHVSPDAFRAKVEAGLLVQMRNCTGLRATVEHDGIAAPSLDAKTGKLWLSIPLN